MSIRKKSCKVKPLSRERSGEKDKSLRNGDDAGSRSFAGFLRVYVAVNCYGERGYCERAFFHCSGGNSKLAALRYACAYAAALSLPSSMSSTASEGAIHSLVRTL